MSEDTTASDETENRSDSLSESLGEISEGASKTRNGLRKGYEALKEQIKNLRFEFYVVIWLAWTTIGDAISNVILARVPLLASSVGQIVEFTGNVWISNLQLLILFVGVMLVHMSIQSRRFKSLEEEIAYMAGPHKTDGGKQISSRDNKGRFKSQSDDNKLGLIGGALAGGAAGSVWGPGGAVAGALLGAIIGDANDDE